MRGHKVITISYFHVAVPKTLTALNPARFITKPFFRYLSTCQQQQHYKAHPRLQLLLLVQLILRCCREAARQNFFQDVFMVRPRISVHQPGWFINRSVFFYLIVHLKGSFFGTVWSYGPHAPNACSRVSKTRASLKTPSSVRIFTNLCFTPFIFKWNHYIGGPPTPFV